MVNMAYFGSLWRSCDWKNTVIRKITWRYVIFYSNPVPYSRPTFRQNKDTMQCTHKNQAGTWNIGYWIKLRKTSKPISLPRRNVTLHNKVHHWAMISLIYLILGEEDEKKKTLDTLQSKIELLQERRYYPQGLIPVRRSLCNCKRSAVADDAGQSLDEEVEKTFFLLWEVHCNWIEGRLLTQILPLDGFWLRRNLGYSPRPISPTLLERHALQDLSLKPFY